MLLVVAVLVVVAATPYDALVVAVLLVLPVGAAPFLFLVNDVPLLRGELYCALLCVGHLAVVVGAPPPSGSVHALLARTKEDRCQILWTG